MSTLTTGKNGQSKPRELSLMVDATNMCQLACRYCYYGAKGNRLMDVRKVFAGLTNFILSQEKVGIITLHYMGGEPLLAWPEILRLNQLVRDFCDRQELNFRWGLTSNLIALDKAKAEHMLKEHAGIHCSIDGPAEIHNFNRPYRGGQPSFNDVVKSLSLALQISPDDTARVTVCPESVGKLTEIAATLFELGFKTVGLFPAYNMLWDDWAVATWSNQLEKCFQLIRGWGDGKTISTVIKDRKRVGDRFTYCGAGKGLWALDVNGFLYYCHHFTNMPEQAIINAANSSPELIQGMISDSLIPPVETKPSEKCLRCPAFDYCNGGCWANNLLVNGKVDEPEKTECQLTIAAVKAISDYLGQESIQPIQACSTCYSCERCYNCQGCLRCEQYCQECYHCQTGVCTSYCQERCEQCQGNKCESYDCGCQGICHSCEGCMGCEGCDTSDCRRT